MEVTCKGTFISKQSLNSYSLWLYAILLENGWLCKIFWIQGSQKLSLLTIKTLLYKNRRSKPSWTNNDYTANLSTVQNAMCFCCTFGIYLHLPLAKWKYNEQWFHCNAVTPSHLFGMYTAVHCVAYVGNQSNHQIFDPSLVPKKLWLIFMGMKQKKSKMADSKKLSFSKPPILNIFS